MNLTMLSGLAPTSSIDIFPYIAGSADGTRLTVIWEHTDTFDGSHTIKASSSSDGGLTWSKAATLSARGISSMVVRGVTGSADLSRVVAFWDAPSDDTAPLPGEGSWCACSYDGGVTWSAAAKLPPYYTHSSGVMNVDSSSTTGIRISTVWTQMVVYPNTWAVLSSSSHDGGATWSSPASIARYEKPAEASPCYLISSGEGGRLTVGWFADSFGTELTGTPRILRTSSTTDGGETWSAPVDGSFPGMADSEVVNFKSSADGKRLVAAWCQWTPGGPTWHGARINPYVVQSSWSSDGGVTWSAPAYLSPPNEHGPIPRLAVSADGKQVTVVWYLNSLSRRGSPPEGDTYLYQVQAASSSDGGVTWTPPRELSELGTEDPPWPQVASSADGTRLTVVWDIAIRDRRPMVQTASSTDGGENWSVTMDRSSPRNEARRPQLTVSADGSLVTAVWFQSFGTNTTIEVSSFDPC